MIAIIFDGIHWDGGASMKNMVDLTSLKGVFVKKDHKILHSVVFPALLFTALLVFSAPVFASEDRITISGNADTPGSHVPTSGVIQMGAGIVGNINTSSLKGLLSGEPITVRTNVGDIIVNGALESNGVGTTWDNTLTLDTGRDLFINAAISNLDPGSFVAQATTGATGKIEVNAGISTAASQTYTAYDIDVAGPLSSSGSSIGLTAATTIALGGNAPPAPTPNSPPPRVCGSPTRRR